MNEEAIDYSYQLFKKDGYSGSIDDYKQLLKDNPEAVSHSYGLFKQNGYADSEDDFKSLLFGAPEQTPDTGKGVVAEENGELASLSAQEDSSSESKPTDSFNITDFVEEQERRKYYDSLKNLTPEELSLEGFDAVPETFEDYKRQVPTLKEELSNASTPEERDFVIQKDKERRAKIKSDLYDRANSYSEKKRGQYLFNEMKGKTDLTDEDKKAIDKEYDRLRRGDLTFLETLEAYVLGAIENPTNILPIAGVPIIPKMPNPDKNQLTYDRLDRKKVDFMKELDDDDRATLNEYINYSPEGSQAQIENLQIETNQILNESAFIEDRLLKYSDNKDFKEFQNKIANTSKEDALQYLENLPEEDKKEFLNDYTKMVDLYEIHQGNLEKFNQNSEDLQEYAIEKDLSDRYFGLGTNMAISFSESVNSIYGGVLSAGLDPVVELTKPDDVSYQEHRERLVEGTYLGYLEETNKELEKIKLGRRLNDNPFSIDRIALLASEQLPVLALIGTGGAAGLGTIGASTYGNKVNEYSKDGDVSATDRIAASLSATGEVLSERITQGILSKSGRAWKAAKREGKLKDLFTKNFVKGVTASTLEEGGSEVLAKLTENFSDIYIVGDSDKNMLTGLKDAFIDGSIMGGLMRSSPEIVGSTIGQFYGKPSDLKEIKAINSQIQALVNEAFNPEISDEAFQVIEDRAVELKKKQDSKVEAYLKGVEKLSKEDVKELSKIGVNIAKEKSKLNSIQKDKSVSEPVKENLQTVYKKKIEELAKKKEEVLNNPTKITKEDKDLKESQKAEPQQSENPFVDLGEGNVRTFSTFMPKYVKDQPKKTVEDYKEVFTNPAVYELGKKFGVEIVELTPELKDKALGLFDVEGKYIGDNLVVVNPEVIGKNTKIGDTQLAGKNYSGTNVLQHEVAHAYTAAVLLENNLSKLEPQELQFREGIEKIFKSKKTPLHTEYGFSNTAEFVAEFLSNESFRKKVEGKDRNIFRKAIDAIAKFINKKTDLNTQEVIDNFHRYLGYDGKVKRNPTEGNVSQEKASKVDAKKSSFTPKKLLSGFPVLSYLDDVWYNNVTSKVDKATSNFVKAAASHNNRIVRSIGQQATTWFNGLPRTVEQLAEKRQLTGKQEESYVVGEQLTKELQALINYNTESAKNVHKVLDPEIYEESERITYDNLTPEEKQLHDALKEINARTHELNYEAGFIDEDTYNKFKDKYIARLYEEFEDLANTDEKGEFIDTKIFGKIYKQRQAIDQWKIDNKVTDPIYLTINRMIRTERNLAVKHYADMVANGQEVSDTPKEGYTLMTGKKYGSLDGKYIPNYLAEDFKGYFFANKYMDSLYDAIKGYDRLQARQFLKKFHTVYNPIVQIGNFMSNHAFAFASGINVVQLWNQLPSARKAIKEKTEDYLFLVKNGIIGSNVLTNDLTSLTESAQQALKMDKDKKGLLEFLKKADDKASEIYASSDDVMKLSAYKALVKAGYTKQEAVERVFDGFQNYATVGKVWDLASKTPVIGNAYIKFQADLMRIMKNAVLKRPLSTAAFLSSIKLMTLIASTLSGEDDEEREIREGRGFIPKINLGFTEIPLVFKAGDKEVNISRYVSPFYEYDIPNKGWLEAASRFMPFQVQTADKSELGQTGISMDAPDVLLGGLYQAFVQNRDFRNKSVSDPYATRFKESGLSDSDKILNKLDYVSRSVVPLYATARDTYLASQYGEDYYGRTKSVGDIFMSKLIKVQTYGEPELRKTIEGTYKTIQYEAKLSNGKVTALKRKMKRDLNLLKERVDAGTLSKEKASRKVEKLTREAEKRLNGYLSEQVKIQEKMNKFVDKVSKLKIGKDIPK